MFPLQRARPEPVLDLLSGDADRHELSARHDSVRIIRNRAHSGFNRADRYTHHVY